VTQPETIFVRWDRLAARRVPVSAPLTFNPSDGYVSVGGVRLEPDSVRVTGPASIVDTIGAVFTEARVFGALVKPLHGKALLMPPPAAMVSYSEETVRFRIDVQRLGEKEIRGVPIVLTNVPEGFTAEVAPPELSLKVQGGVDVLASLGIEDVSATIDVKAAGALPRRSVAATIRIPGDAVFSDVEPKVFELTVRR
jgi:hypothetical protein